MARKRTDKNGDSVAEPVPADDAPAQPEALPEEERNLPCHVIKFDLIRISIWRNETELGTRYNCTAVRIYRGSDDRWYTATSFGYSQLLNLAKALDLAHTW